MTLLIWGVVEFPGVSAGDRPDTESAPIWLPWCGVALVLMGMMMISVVWLIDHRAQAASRVD